MRGLLLDVSPLRESRAFRRVFFGSLLSNIGSALTTVAIPIQVYRSTGSSLDVGLLGLATGVPLIVLGLYGGAVADRLDRRRLVLLSSVGLTGVSAGLYVQSALGGRLLWLVYVLVTLQSALRGLQAPALRSFGARLLGLEKQTAVQGLAAISFQITLTVGPLLAGLVIAVSGVGLAYAVDAVSFSASLYAVAKLPPILPEGGGGQRGLRAIAAGLAFVRSQPVLLGTLVADLDATVLGFSKALFPAFAAVRLHGGAQTVGLLYAALAAGGVVGSIFSGPLNRVGRQGVVLVISVGVWSACFAAFGLSTSLWLSLGLLFAAGAADIVNGILRGTILQVNAPDSLRGRVNSVGFVAGAGGPSMGDIEAGAVAAATSPMFSAVSGGCAALVGICLIAWRSPGLLRYDTRRPGPSPDVGLQSP